ncbi:MAG: SdrD B-like domain-containing protein [Caldilineaceae bacterium]
MMKQRTISATLTSGNHNTASPYYENLFNPEGSVFLSAFDGQNAQGNWTLNVCDDAGSDTGTIRRVALYFDGTAVVVAIPGHITGKVFQDHGQQQHNGRRYGAIPNLAVDAGVAGITVTAYDTNGATFSAVTDSTGAYDIDASAGAGPFRVEFTTLPTGYYPTFHNNSSGSNTTAPDSTSTTAGTTVQFVPASAVSVGAGNVNLGINYPDDYSQSSPQLAASLVRNSTDDTGFPSTLSVVKYDLSSFEAVTYAAYGGSDPRGTPMTRTTVSSRSAVGNVHSLAWQRTTKTLFQAAYARGQDSGNPVSNGGLGPGGLVAIYKTTSAGTTSVFATVSNVSTFNGAVADVGKVGIGDIELSEDESKLYAINMFAKTLVTIPVSGNPPVAGAQTQTALPQPGDCTAAETHPFGLGQYRGKLYIGMVCGGPATSNLRAYVYEYNGSTFAQKLNFSMNYTRTYNEDQNNLWPSGNNNANYDINHNVMVWDDTPSPNFEDSANFSTLARTEPRFAPMLTDIAFDDGDMVLGFRRAHPEPALQLELGNRW